ncbi:MAG: FAD-dependent oxidoreductase [Thermoplasmata archaeon]|nr:MAG: FAD-dependent oxidoreductase [Thermoplasmata archaeon]
MSKGVAVIGGGIAGVQAALDLAEQGISVYIVEKSPSLGGKMAQLDKTFPTNDCSICILSPKLVAAGRHPNITLLTNSELKDLKGEAGNFKAFITKKPRYIIEEKCTACSLCAEACPVEKKSEFDEGLSPRKAAYITFPQAVPLKYIIDRKGTPPCQAGCPAKVHVQAYIVLISQGKYKEALESHRETNPLPQICGRVCPHPCEDVCNRGEVDSPIAIADLKRFIADWELENQDEEIEPFEKISDKKVAIIGSGPAGLTCAYYLAKMGHSPTIFEALPVAGGMLAVGIPDYRLPKNILEAEIEYIKKKGVEIVLKKRFGKDFTMDDLKNDGFQAVFLGIGAHGSKKLAIPGEDLDGVIPGVKFLRDVNLGKKVKLGKKVVVIGGGDVAIDAVRVAHRMGSEAFILYRRTRAEMPAHESEIQATESEGIKIQYLTQPVKILGKGGKVVGVECIKMELGEPDESGRRRPVPIKDSEFTLDVDCVMPAIGQSPEIESLKALGLKTAKNDTIIVNENSYATNIKGIFAAGDVQTGPATVVKAVGSARKAAYAIDSYLNGEEYKPEAPEENVVEFEDLKLEYPVKKEERVLAPQLPPSKRKKNFNEVVSVISEEQAKKEALRCLNCGTCSGCYQCIKVCEPDAIDFSQKQEEIELELGSVIVMPGYDEIDPMTRPEFGHDRFDDVITALEFERILSASGPFGGHIKKISDGKEPKNMAFIQCVGSRDRNRGVGYCSAVCCMYAIKEAIIAKEHSPDLDITIFHMDIRAFGKEFDYYYQRAQDLGIKFIRSRVADIWEEDKNLIVNFVDEKDEPDHMNFDMVVLSNGIGRPKDSEKHQKALDIELNDYGFCRTSVFHPIETSRKGVFVGGAFSEPKDIPDSVAQASGAAALALGYAEKKEKEIEAPMELRDTSGEPRIGVLICHCGINIGNFVDVEDVAEYAGTLPGVVHSENVLYACSQDIQEKIKDLIMEHDLNRVVVASCTPRTHEPLFQGTIEEAGLNPYLFDMTNIREQCSWVHMHAKEKATEKAKDLVRMTVAKSNLLKPLERESLKVNPTCLVIGGGIAGLFAALDVANNGFKVLLLEKEKELGGNLNRVNSLISESNPKEQLKKIIEEVEEHKKIQVLCNADVKSTEGYVGNFTTTFEHEGESKQFEHGTVIVATGAKPYTPTEYLYGKDKKVITQLELEKMLGEKKFKGKSVVMIQCVGSRDENHGYCSRICCTQAVKNSLRIKEIDLDTQIFILYKDMRTYGFKEDYYKKASDMGVKFILYNDEKKPVVKNKDGLTVEVLDPVLNQVIRIKPDNVVLSCGMEPQEGNYDLAKMLKVPLSKDGFFLEAHMKLRPVDFATDGIFLCGAAHFPKFVNESISQAAGAASRACTILSKEAISAEGIVSHVDEDVCFGCGICILNCPYNAIESDDETQKARVLTALCKGCGVCGATCPKHAITMSHFTDQQVQAQIDAFCEEVP